MMIYISLNMCSLVPKTPYEASSRPGRAPLNLEMTYLLEGMVEVGLFDDFRWG